jgi:hypothetical protein
MARRAGRRGRAVPGHEGGLRQGLKYFFPYGEGFPRHFPAN